MGRFSQSFDKYRREKALRRVNPQKALAAAAARRRCGDCTGCDQSVPCLWKQGGLADGQRPEELGVRFETSAVESGGVRQLVLIAHEVHRGAFQATATFPDVLGTSQALATGAPVVWLNWRGEVVKVLGPPGRVEALFSTAKKPPPPALVGADGQPLVSGDVEITVEGLALAPGDLIQTPDGVRAVEEAE